ncbi:fibronectin type III domain-containing protein [Actinoplanes sp. HUAS TT8]|uniref:fibronectin type III domain-containing protein n=1 Tax=Actinoplanes sp. HUAS TT8 TaxID=3447453 RepID=UPI003F51DB07
MALNAIDGASGPRRRWLRGPTLVGRSVLAGLLVGVAATAVLDTPARADPPIATETGTVDTSTPWTDAPGRIAVSPNGTYIWATDLSKANLLHMTGTGSPPTYANQYIPASNPWGLAFSSDSNTLYVTTGTPSRILRINPSDGNLVGSTFTGSSQYNNAEQPKGITVARIGGADILYVANSGVRQVAVFDALGVAVNNNPTITTNGNPIAVAASADGSRVFVGEDNGVVQMIDTSTNTIVATAGTAHTYGSGIVNDLVVSGNVLLAAADGDTLDQSTPGFIDAYAIGANSLEPLLSSDQVTDGSLRFTQLALSPDGQTVYGASGGQTPSAKLFAYNVSDFSSSTLSSVTALGSAVPVGTDIWGVTAAPTGAKLYVTSAGPGTMSSYGALHVFSTAAAPGTPRNVVAAAGNRSAVVTWDAPQSSGSSSISGYTVTSNPDGLTCTALAPRTCRVNGLTNTTDYTFRVTATNGEGTGSYGTSNQVTPDAVPYGYHLNFFAGRGSRGDPSGTVVPTSDYVGYVQGLAVNAAGDVYIADRYHDRVERVDHATNRITVVAGTGMNGAPTGTAVAATLTSLSNPRAVALAPNGDFYIADTDNSLLEKVAASDSKLYVVAGTASPGLPTAGTATGSPLLQPAGVAVDPAGANVYIADSGNSLIEKINVSTGELSIVAGRRGYSGTPTVPGAATGSNLDHPRGVAVDDDGNIFIADTANHRIERVDHTTGALTYVGGTGTGGLPTDNVVATTSNLGDIYALALGPDNALYLADATSNVVERIDLGSGILNVIAGAAGVAGAPTDDVDAAASMLKTPHGVAVSATDGAVYVADNGNKRVHKLTSPPRVPGRPTGLTTRPNDLVSPVSFTKPVFTGGSAISSYEFTTDNGATQHTLPTSGTGTTLTGSPTGLAGGASVTIKVRARNTTGAGAWSEATTFVPDTVPDAPGAPVAVPGLGSATVTWGVPANAGSAILGYSVTPYLGSSAQPTTWYPATARSASITGLTAGRGYTFKVGASNSAGEGPASLASNEVVPTSPSPSPSASPSPTVGPSVSPSPGDTPTTPGTSPTPSPTTTPTTPPKVELDLNLGTNQKLSGSKATLSGGGTQPRTGFYLTLHSDPVLLASGTTDDKGSFNAVVTMPTKACVAGGLHQLELTATAADGSPIKDTSWIVLDANCGAQTGSGTRPPSSVVSLGSVLFPYQSTKLSASAKRSLKVKAAAAKGAGLITLTGYTTTDRKSTSAIAAVRKLSRQRAAVVSSYLKSLGVTSRIKVVGVGDSAAKKPRWTKYNRRVVITVKY